MHDYNLPDNVTLADIDASAGYPDPAACPDGCCELCHRAGDRSPVERYGLCSTHLDAAATDAKDEFSIRQRLDNALTLYRLTEKEKNDASAEVGRLKGLLRRCA